MSGCQPSLQGLVKIVDSEHDANTFPVFKTVIADGTPQQAYLKVARPGSGEAQPSFLFESAVGGEQLARFSFIGTNPRKIIKTGAPHGPDVDPLVLLEQELKSYKQSTQIPITSTVPLTGGAVGYVSYDCIKYFEPRTARPMDNTLQLPEAALMLFDTIVAFDNVFQRLQIIHNIHIDRSDPTTDSFETLPDLYAAAEKSIQDIVDRLQGPDYTVPQGKVEVKQTYESNIGREGYEAHVAKLKDEILKGSIIQAVPSQRVAHPTDLHAFNIYKQLRTVNPSPYMFYIDYLDFQIVGASPELLVKCDTTNKIVTHPIAGTVKRGATAAEDDQLATQLLSSAKDRAEHVMLVDLARNDVNRVCDPFSCSVDRLLTVERFSHVMHLVSQVSGTLRPDKTRFDAFRSIFPAGTVSGAPKIRAMELIAELEQDKRGVYAGAVGHWGYSNTMDTCIALRTMVVKDKTAYLQAGGGIVFDSDPYEEYIETVNKMKANEQCLRDAEQYWAEKS